MNQASTTIGGFEIDFWRLLRKRWQLILFGLFVGCVIAVAYQLAARELFQAKMEILVGERSSELASSGTSMGSELDGTTVRDEKTLATHMELIRSPLILNAAIRDGKLDELPSFIEAVENDTLPLDYLSDNLKVAKGGDGAAKDASVLRATFRDPDPESAAKVLQAVFESYRNYVESQTKQGGTEALDLLNETLEANEEDLRLAEEEYRTYISGSVGLLEGEDLKSVHHDRLKDIEREMTQLRSDLSAAKARIEIVQANLDSESEKDMNDLERLALLSEKEVERLKLFLEMTRGEAMSEQFQAEQPIRSEVARTEYNRLLSLILREQNLSADFGDDHPLVQATREEIRAIKQFILDKAPETEFAPELKKMSATEMLNAYRALLTNDVNEIGKRLEQLKRESILEHEQAKLVEAEFLRGQALKAKLERARERYEDVVKRSQEIRLTSDYAGFSTDLLSPPLPPDRKAWPKAIIVLAIGMAGGLVLGGGLAIWAEMTDHTFRDPQDLQESLRTQILAHIPRFEAMKQSGAGATQSMSQKLRVFHSPRSVDSEVFRMARTAILHQAKQHDQKVLVITSPMPGDGKSTTVANIALSAAQAGKKVLLIDADMRRPTLDRLFGVPKGRGLSDYLQGEAELSDVALATAQKNLYLLSHGSPTSEPAELLESFGLNRLISECRDNFDLVLIDSPPLLAVADPVIIAGTTDAAILVVQVQKNARRPVERSRQMLADSHVPLAGVIVNGSMSGERGFGYGEYVAGYEYGYAADYTKSYASVSKKQTETDDKELASSTSAV